MVIFVLTKNGKVVINKELLQMLLKLIGKQLNTLVFNLIQCDTPQSLAEVQKLVNEKIPT